MSQIKSQESLRERIRNIQDGIKLAQGDSASEVVDPTNQGVVSIPSDAENTTAKKRLPSTEHTNVNGGVAGKTMENASVYADGEKAPAAKVEDPTDPTILKGAAILSKIASAAKAKKAADEGADAHEPVKGTKPAQPATDDKATPADNTNENKGQIQGTVVATPEANPGNPPNVEAIKEEKKADSDALAFGPDFQVRLANVVKLASLGTAILENEENYKVASDIIKRQKGQDMANEILKQASIAAQNIKNEIATSQAIDEAIKNASPQEVEAIKQALHIENMLKSASAEDKGKIEKMAALRNKRMLEFKSDFEKAAYAAGAQDNAMAMDAIDASAGQPQVPDISPEELLALLEQAVANGLITAEAATALVEMIVSGGAEAPASQPSAAGGEVVEEAKEAAALAGMNPEDLINLIASLSPEEQLQLVQEALAAGLITEEDVAAVAAQVQGAGAPPVDEAAMMADESAKMAAALGGLSEADLVNLIASLSPEEQLQLVQEALAAGLISEEDIAAVAAQMQTAEAPAPVKEAGIKEELKSKWDSLSADDKKSIAATLGLGSVGAVSGAIAGNRVAGEGNKAKGTIAGAATGAAAGAAAGYGASKVNYNKLMAAIKAKANKAVDKTKDVAGKAVDKTKGMYDKATSKSE